MPFTLPKFTKWAFDYLATMVLDRRDLRIKPVDWEESLEPE